MKLSAKALVLGSCVILVAATMMTMSVFMTRNSDSVYADDPTATFEATSTVPPTPDGGVPTAQNVDVPAAHITVPAGWADATATPQSGTTVAPPNIATPTP